MVLYIQAAQQSNQELGNHLYISLSELAYCNPSTLSNENRSAAVPQ